MVAACMWVSREWNNELRTMVVCVWEDISRNNGDGIGLEIGTVKLDCRRRHHRVENDRIWRHSVPISSSFHPSKKKDIFKMNFSLASRCRFRRPIHYGRGRAAPAMASRVLFRCKSPLTNRFLPFPNGDRDTTMARAGLIPKL